jgi:Tfp pilus assembly protein FimT
VTELSIVVGVFAILTAVSAPVFLTFLRTSTLRAGAEEISTVLNRARQMAIRDNRSMCVQRTGSRLQYRVGGCGGAVWAGPGTDGAGVIQLTNDITVANGPDVVFTYLGTATSAGTFTVAGHDGSTLSVIVAPSGRVSLGP